MKHTPGPWAWFGSPDSRGFYLATTHSGRRYVMDFVRMGMNRAQPRFQVDGVMEDGKDLCRFEVAPNVVGVEAAKKEGSGVYRMDIIGFDHPDAKLIAAAPELLEALCDLRNAIRLHELHTGLPLSAGPLKADWDKATAILEKATA